MVNDNRLAKVNKSLKDQQAEVQLNVVYPSDALLLVLLKCIENVSTSVHISTHQYTSAHISILSAHISVHISTQTCTQINTSVH